jgi:hypothetical protein
MKILQRSGHHVAVSVEAKQMKVYLDKTRAFTVPDLRFSPVSIRFTEGKAPCSSPT